MLSCFARAPICIALVGFSLSGCVTFGNTDAVKQANELAIACRTDDALALTAQTTDTQTLAGGIAELQRIVFLRDAGRFAEADRLLNARNQRVSATAQDRAETESAIEESLTDLRSERRSRTGQSVCL